MIRLLSHKLLYKSYCRVLGINVGGSERDRHLCFPT